MMISCLANEGTSLSHHNSGSRNRVPPTISPLHPAPVSDKIRERAGDVHTGGKNRNRVCRNSVGGVRWESLHCKEIFQDLIPAF